MRVDDRESQDPGSPVKSGWFSLMTSWSSPRRVALLVLFLLFVLIAVRLLDLELVIGPVRIGSR
jgi:hypothetical protein